MSKQRTVTIGYLREDFDFRVLATLSNMDDDMEDVLFDELVERTRKSFADAIDYNSFESEIVALDRQDIDDYITLEDEELKLLGVSFKDGEPISK